MIAASCGYSSDTAQLGQVTNVCSTRPECLHYCLVQEAVMKSKRYPKVKWDSARIKRLFRAGKNVSQIAVAIGYPQHTGNNRVRNFLKKAGLYKEAK
jgi:hypothetical protein